MSQETWIEPRVWRRPSVTIDKIATDRQLVRRVRRGDSKAFDVLVRRYMRPALAVAWEFTESRDDADDVVQDSFHRTLRALDDYDDSRPFRPWFFTIVRNVGRNAAARSHRWDSDPVTDTLPAEEVSRLSEIERWEIRKRVSDGLALLSANQRACFRLCDLEGFRAKEVAEMLGMKEATVRVHLFRARGALREVLRPLREEAESQ